MKLKLIIMFLAVVLFVGLVPSSSARASVEDFPDLPSGFNYEYYYAKEWTTGRYYLFGSELPFYFSSKANGITTDSDFAFYEWLGSSWKFEEMRSAGSGLSPSGVVVSNHDILREDGTIFFPANVVQGYSFLNWCKDAGLNCLASSNESSSVIPYTFNDYLHIVRRTSNGKYILTTIGNSVMADNIEDYTLMISEDMGSFKVWNLYCMEDINGYLLNVRQYEYDTDGWRLLSYNTYDSRDTDDYIIDLGSGSGLDSTKVLCYTNIDIYSEYGLDLLVSASEKYGDIILEIPDKPINPEMPTETPKPTNVPVIDLSNLDTSLKLEDITINGFKYNGIEYKWGNIKEHIDSKDLEDYAVFYNDYNRQLVFVWAFDDLIVQGKLKKSGLRYFEYYFEFITSANNTSVTPYAIIKYQINTDGTLTEIENVLTETDSNNHQFEFAWTNAEYKPRLDDFSTFDNYITYVLNNNIVVSNCDIYDNAGVLLKTSISHDNSKIQIENIPDTEFGVLKHFLYEKLPIIGTVEVFIAKFKSVLNTMKETNKAPEIIMNVKDFYGYSGELNVLDLSWYEPYREYVKAIISALLIVPFILWVYRKGLPDAIGGI